MFTIRLTRDKDDKRWWHVYSVLPQLNEITELARYDNLNAALCLIHYLNGGDPVEVFIGGDDA